MNKQYCNIYIFGLILLFSLVSEGCNLGSVSAGRKTSESSTTTQTEAKNDNTSKESFADNNEATVSPASVAGTYDYDTYHNGEGYDNSLEIKDAGEGRLYVFLSGSYIYKVGETQSMHEAEGKGDAKLRGNTATATLVDEAGKPCRAIITFKSNQADVKIPDTCQFNIALDGVYKKVGVEKSDEKTATTPQKTREVSYTELQDFVNDFDLHQVGERYTITNVPANKIQKTIRADEFGNTSYKNLFYLEADDDDGYVGSSLLTSRTMTKNLATSVEFEPASLRVTAVLVESRGKFDVYRMSFATKIEGLSDDGSVMWTATGDQPAKTKFQH